MILGDGGETVFKCILDVCERDRIIFECPIYFCVESRKVNEKRKASSATFSRR